MRQHFFAVCFTAAVLFAAACTPSLKNNSDFQALEFKVNQLETYMASEFAALRRDLGLSANGYAPSGSQSIPSEPATYGPTTPIDKAAPTAPTAPDPSRVSNKEVPVLYGKIMGIMKRGDYDKAGRLFAQLAAAAPNHPLAANCLYWLGECHYSQARYQQAVAAFDSVIRKYPNHHKAPDAMFKKAYSLSRLDNGAAAMSVLRELLARYPKSRSAAMVRAGKVHFARP